MKTLPKIIIAIAVIIVIGKYISSLDKAAETINYTTMEVSSESINLGKINMYEIPELSFIIYNTGSNELLINDISGDCFCTIPLWESKPVAPSDSSEFRVSITKETRGFFMQQVMIHGNFHNTPRIIKITGQIM